MPLSMEKVVHDHILQRGAAFRERGAALRALINAVKARLISVEILEIQAIVKFKSGRPHQHTHTHQLQ
jgi:hypothetical protein